MPNVTSFGFGLVVTGENRSLDDVIPLTAFNSESEAAAGVPLTVRGLGVTAGAVPFDGGVPLTVERLPAGAIPMTVFGPGVPTTDALPLLTTGVLAPGSGLPLVVSTVDALVGASAPLTTSGY